MEGGSFILANAQIRENAIEFLNSLPLDGPTPWRVRVDKARSRRSLEQNALYWKWLTIIGSETGNSKRGMDAYFLKRYAPVEEVKIAGEEILVRLTTSGMNSKQMSEYMDNIQAWAIEWAGIRLPVPQDLWRD